MKVFVYDVLEVDCVSTYEKQGLLTKKAENNHCSTYKITKTTNNTKNTEPTTNYLYNFSETNTHPNNPENANLINQLDTPNKGEALDSQTRVNMENDLNYNFRPIQIHTDTYATNLTNALNANATCYGHNIYFAKNQYNPNTKQGTNLLKHELNHYQQQTQTGTKQIQNQDKLESDTSTVDKYATKLLRIYQPESGEGLCNATPSEGNIWGLAGTVTAGFVVGLAAQIGIIRDSHDNVGVMLTFQGGMMAPQLSATGNLIYSNKNSICEMGYVVDKEETKFTNSGGSVQIGGGGGEGIVGSIDIIRDIDGEVTGAQGSIGGGIGLPVDIHILAGKTFVIPTGKGKTGIAEALKVISLIQISTTPQTAIPFWTYQLLRQISNRLSGKDKSSSDP